MLLESSLLFGRYNHLSESLIRETMDRPQIGCTLRIEDTVFPAKQSIGEDPYDNLLYDRFD